MNTPKTFPKEGKWSLINTKNCITNLHRNFLYEYIYYLPLSSIPLPRRAAAAASSEGGPMAAIWKENSSVLIITSFL